MSFAFRSPAAYAVHSRRGFSLPAAVSASCPDQPGGSGTDLLPVISDDRRRSPLVISTNAVLARTDTAAIVRGAGTFEATP